MEQDVYFIHEIFYPHNYKKVRNEITIVLFKVTDEIENESNFIIKNISFNELIEKGIASYNKDNPFFHEKLDKLYGTSR